jgi:hypothetical protein
MGNVVFVVDVPLSVDVVVGSRPTMLQLALHAWPIYMASPSTVASMAYSTPFLKPQRAAESTSDCQYSGRTHSPYKKPASIVHNVKGLFFPHRSCERMLCLKEGKRESERAETLDLA